MNRRQLEGTVGKRLRFRPDPHGRFGSPLKGEWQLETVDDEGATLTYLPAATTVRIMLDHIHSYATDSSGATDDGYLVLHAYVRERPDGRFEVVPIVPRLGDETPRVRLTQDQFAELAGHIRRMDEGLKQMVRESASEPSRAEASRVQKDAHAWIEDHVGPAEAMSFMAAQPDPQVPDGFPWKYAGLHQRMRGRLTHLIQLARRLQG